jgi:hypothetical protein
MQPSPKLLLLPLIPVLALGILEVASAIVAPNTVSIDPDVGWEPVSDRCIDCAVPA